MVDRALRGPDAARDAETRALLDQWLQRPRRDFYVDVSSQVANCGGDACDPIPVPQRPPATFLWEVSPFQLKGGGSGLIENAGVDYLLPYWMARYYGVITSNGGIQSAAAPSNAIAPGSLASLYGENLAAAPAQAGSLPLPFTLGGVALSVTDSAGAQRNAPLLYVSPSQINFLLPENVASGIGEVHCDRRRGRAALYGHGSIRRADPIQHERDRLRGRGSYRGVRPGGQSANSVSSGRVSMRGQRVHPETDRAGRRPARFT